VFLWPSLSCYTSQEMAVLVFEWLRSKLFESSSVLLFLLHPKSNLLTMLFDFRSYHCSPPPLPPPWYNDSCPVSKTVMTASLLLSSLLRLPTLVCFYTVLFTLQSVHSLCPPPSDPPLPLSFPLAGLRFSHNAANAYSFHHIKNNMGCGI
jgi:hypothetical protein